MKLRQARKIVKLSVWSDPRLNTYREAYRVWFRHTRHLVGKPYGKRHAKWAHERGFYGWLDIDYK